jgi:DNA polymerase-1
MPARSDLGKKLRSAFVADEGNRLVVADYNQMELRVLTHFSQDQLLLEAYLGDTVSDLHTMTASRMFNKGEDEITKQERSVAKMINFGIAYGIAPRGLFESLTAEGIEVSERECEKFIAEYFRTYGGVSRWLNETEREAKRQGYVTNLFGWRRRLAARDRRETRQVRNFVIQSTAADICKDAMARLHESLPDGAYMIAQVHDELVVECKADQAEAGRGPRQRDYGVCAGWLQCPPEGGRSHRRQLGAGEVTLS